LNTKYYWILALIVFLIFAVLRPIGALIDLLGSPDRYLSNISVFGLTIILGVLTVLGLIFFALKSKKGFYLVLFVGVIEIILGVIFLILESPVGLIDWISQLIMLLVFPLAIVILVIISKSVFKIDKIFKLVKK